MLYRMTSLKQPPVCSGHNTGPMCDQVPLYHVLGQCVNQQWCFISPHRDEGADREAVDFEPGNQYILRYNPVSSLVRSGVAKLV